MRGPRTHLSAIWRAGSDDVRKRMYNAILLTGGGQLFRGFVPFLEHRYALGWLVSSLFISNPYGCSAATSLRQTVPSHAYAMSSAMQVLTNIKDMDPRILPWKGGSILGVYRAPHHPPWVPHTSLTHHACSTAGPGGRVLD